MDPRDELDEAAEPFLWREGEREEMQRELAARQKQIARDEALAWCREQKEQRTRKAKTMATDYPCDATGAPLRGHDATRSYDAPQPAGDETYWDNWRGFVRRTIKGDLLKAQLMVADEIGKLFGEERSARQTLEAECAVVKQELTALKLELAELRGELKTKSAMADMEARMARIEQERSARSPLRTVGSAVSA